ncbi:MAG: efflux RND transporter periplasmic adaptor subunit [Hyphomicrobiaceae bacterium]
MAFELARGKALLILAGLVVATILAGCDRPTANPAKSPAPPILPIVTVAQPASRSILEWDEYVGRFDAVDTVELRARVSGYLTGVHFVDGQIVKKGDLLFTIDPRPFERVLAQVRAELEATRIRAEYTAKEVKRGRPLVERKTMSDVVFDQRVNAGRDAAAAVKIAEAKVKSAELDVEFTKVTAPFTGRVSRHLVSVGNYVSGGSATGTLLTTLVTLDPIQFYFDVSQSDYLKYVRLTRSGSKASAAEKGTPVELALQDEKGFPHKGRIDFVDNRLDLGTGTMRVRAILDNPSGLFSPGMFARVRVVGSERYTALLLPDAAIGTDQTKKFVYVVNEIGVVARRAVTLGPVVGGLRVVRTGLRPTDWIIVKGLVRARPGVKVTPKRETIKVTEETSGATPRPARP